MRPEGLVKDKGERERLEKITFALDGGEEAAFYVLEQTRLGGADYLLVSDKEGDDGTALILKDVSRPQDAEAVYEIVEDDAELDAVASLFSDLLEDVDLER